jgi:hypothetical protein
MILALIIHAMQFIKYFTNIRLQIIGIWPQVLFAFFLWIIFRKFMPRIFGTWYWQEYFFYFVLGIGLYAFIQVNKNNLIRFSEILFSIKAIWVPCALFLLLTPYWSLTADNNLMPNSFNFIGQSYVNSLYRYVVATGGICVALYFSRKIYLLNRISINKSISFLGKMSIGIYALHGFFLHINPPFFAPLLLSAAMSFLILQVPVLRGILLGEAKSSKG